MPRYMVERNFSAPLEIPSTTDGQKAMLGVVDNNMSEQVTWVRSFVTHDKTKTFCVSPTTAHPRGERVDSSSSRVERPAG